MSAVLPGFEDEAQDVLTCTKCNQTKHVSKFSLDKSYVSTIRYMAKCKDCIRAESKKLRQLHKTAPPKPDACCNCGATGVELHLDHDHDNTTYRGWCCRQCNWGTALLGDTLESLKRFLKNVRKAKRDYEQFRRSTGI